MSSSSSWDPASPSFSSASPSSPYSLLNSLDALSLSTTSAVPTHHAHTSQASGVGFPSAGETHSRRSSLLSNPSVPSNRSRQPSDASTSSGFSLVGSHPSRGGSVKPRLSASSEESGVLVEHEHEPNGGSATSEGNGRIEGDRKKPTRRSGQKARKRAENVQNRDAAAVEDILGAGSEGTPRKPSSERGSRCISSQPSAAVPSTVGRRTYTTVPVHIEDDGSDEDEEVDGLSDLAIDSDEDEHEARDDDVTPLSSPRRIRMGYPASITSSEDAESSIDQFLSAPGTRMSKAEKLRLWQSLCYELGLAYFHESEPVIQLPDLPIAHASRFDQPQLSKREPIIKREPESPCSSRSTTPTPTATPLITPPDRFGNHPADTFGAAFHPISMPQSLAKAGALLKQYGHVNLADYFDARSEAARIRDKAARSGGLADEDDELPGTYQHLLFPSATKLRKYSIENRKFIKLGRAKSESLQPLLRDMSFRPRRIRGESS